jgi:hypothetical protein
MVVPEGYAVKNAVPRRPCCTVVTAVESHEPGQIFVDLKAKVFGLGGRFSWTGDVYPKDSRHPALQVNLIATVLADIALTPAAPSFDIVVGSGGEASWKTSLEIRSRVRREVEGAVGFAVQPADGMTVKVGDVVVAELDGVFLGTRAVTFLFPRSKPFGPRRAVVEFQPQTRSYPFSVPIAWTVEAPFAVEPRLIVLRPRDNGAEVRVTRVGEGSMPRIRARCAQGLSADCAHEQSVTKVTVRRNPSHRPQRRLSTLTIEIPENGSLEIPVLELAEGAQ